MINILCQKKVVEETTAGMIVRRSSQMSLRPVFLSLLKAAAVSCSVTQPETVHRSLMTRDPPFQENPTSTPNLRRAGRQM